MSKEIIGYAKLNKDNSIELAPKNYGGISNFNNSTDLMIKNGFYPLIKSVNQGNLPLSKYILSEEKIKITYKSFPSGEEINKKIQYIYQEFYDYDLDYYKNQKKQQINSIKLTSLDIGVPILYKDILYHCQLDADGKANILGIKAKILDKKYEPLIPAIQFKTYENIVLLLTPEEFLKLADASFDYSEYVVFEKEKLLVLIDNAKSREELDVIIWEDKDPVTIDIKEE